MSHLGSLPDRSRTPRRGNPGAFRTSAVNRRAGPQPRPGARAAGRARNVAPRLPMPSWTPWSAAPFRWWACSPASEPSATSSLTQLRLLGVLRDRRPRMTELAAFLGLDKSTLSGLVDRAERRGLVARDKNPQDRRVVDVFLTPPVWSRRSRCTARSTVHWPPRGNGSNLMTATDWSGRCTSPCTRTTRAVADSGPTPGPVSSRGEPASTVCGESRAPRAGSVRR